MDGSGARVALYVGGFLGPFGGGVVTAMLVEMGADLDVSTGTAASSLTSYLLPFALLMVVSGTLGTRWGPRQTVRIAYLVYMLSSVLCALAPTFAVLQVGRVLQGGANSFTTPLLLATLAAITPPARLGRALGTFGALQAAGQTTAPLVGGLAAEVNWRLAFVAIAVVAAGLFAAGIPSVNLAEGPPPRLREAMRPYVLRIGVVAMLGWGAIGGLNFLIAFRAEDDFGLGPTARGLVLTGFGVAGIIAARLVGGAIDRVGARRGVLLGALGGAALVLIAGTAAMFGVMVAAWSLAGVAGQFMLVGVNAAVLGVGTNRGGAVSVVQAFRFTGAAIAPPLLTPIYAVHPDVSFLIPALLVGVLAPILMPKPPRVSS